MSSETDEAVELWQDPNAGLSGNFIVYQPPRGTGHGHYHHSPYGEPEIGPTRSGRLRIPLKNVEVNAIVTNQTACVRLLQKYENDGKWYGCGCPLFVPACGHKFRGPAPIPRSLECVFAFPIDPAAAVISLRARIGKTEITTSVKPADDARKTYETARDAGNKAVLLERDDRDVFTIYVGNVGPGEIALVELMYVTELGTTEVEDPATGPGFVPGKGHGNARRTATKFTLPSAIAPRFKSEPTPGRPKIDDMLVPKTLVDYRLRISIRVKMYGSLERAWSPSHPNLLFSPVPGGDVDALLSADSLPLDRDIVLLFLVAAGTDAACTSAWSPELGELAICTSFVARTAPGDKGIADVKADYVLVIDRSGSMGGEKIQSARDAGAVFLKALPPSSRFDIIVFDNVAEAFNQTLQEATPQNVAVNIAALQKIEARGGTETDSALKLAYEHIVKTRQADAAGQKRPAYVLLATDGQIGTGDPSVKSAGDALKNHGICTYVLGIGFAVAHGTVEAIATSGGGVAESVLPSESIVSKVMGIASKMVGRKLVGAAVEVTPPGGWRESFSSGVPESHSRIPVGTVSLCYSVIAPTDAAIAKNASALESAGDVRVGVSYVVEESTEKQQTMGSAIIPRINLRGSISIGKSVRELGAPSAAWRGIAPSDMVTLTAVGAPETKSDIGDWASSADFEGFASPAIVGSWLHKLAAAKRARELENNASDMRDPAKSKTVLAQLRDVGLRYSLPTRETSLVGVSITPGATPSAPPIKAVVPLGLPTGEDSFFGGGVFMMSAAAPIPQGAYHMSGPIAQGLPRAALSGGMTARKMSVQLESMPANRVPPTPAKDTRERVIVKAILEQQPDGRWKADSAIIDLLGIKDVVTRAMGILSIHESLTELKDAVVTAAVIRAFRNDFAEFTPAWTAAVQKAEAFINNALRTSSVSGIAASLAAALEGKKHKA